MYIDTNELRKAETHFKRQSKASQETILSARAKIDRTLNHAIRAKSDSDLLAKLDDLSDLADTLRRAVTDHSHSAAAIQRFGAITGKNGHAA